jgi:5-methylcytosine-specific restriction endonuclease McrA
MDLSDSALLYPKRVREAKPKKGLQKKTPLKTHYEPIPKEVKEAVLEEKGRLCFLGCCPVCGGQAEVEMNDDFHHFPHKSRGGKDCVEHLWPGKRECHDYIQTHPLEEKEMFKEIEAAGIKVVWKVELK